MSCPECDTKLAISVEEAKGYHHIYEYCPMCGYVKAYVDYLDNDTGELDYSGIEH